MRQLDSTSTRVPTNTAPSRSAEPVSGYAIGDLVRLTCESPAHGGAFVARSEKGVVFASPTSALKTATISRTPWQ